ncbi:MAG TPA: ABC transporter permease [Candidatus Dormibacteraeota bacterium]|jgi:branched-chain amino acid transport system permease protein|nr:ABC transporter permease [Candidatus Dormibacteraeota bacterium]
MPAALRGLEPQLQRLQRLRDAPQLRPAPVRWAAVGVIFLLVFQSIFHLTVGNYINGLMLGALYGVLAVGIILIYRALRIINFAAAAVGSVPAIFAFMADIKGWINYVEALPIALIGGALAGLLTDVVVMRRFARGSRLIATVATIGVAQSFAILAFFIPIWMGKDAATPSYVPTPWSEWRITDGRGAPLLTGNQVFALVSVLVASVAVWAFLRYSRIGIGLRAASENADRAGLLGIPVRTVQTVAWTLAGALAALAIYGQGPLIGVPRDTTLGFNTLLYGLAAAVIAGMEGIWTALAAGLAIGLVIFGSVANYGESDLASALMLVIIIAALLARRSQLARAYTTGVATWREVKIFRRVPSQLVHLPEVWGAKLGIGVAFLALALLLPLKLVGAADVPMLTILPVYGIIAVSLVVLTGWAGQISLGQFGIVGMAAGVSGGLVANHGIDFFAALAIAVLVGALSAVVIGLPALRIQGLYLAVTTLAFGFVVPDFMLNNHYAVGAHIMPTGYAAQIRRPLLYGRFDLNDDTIFYFVCLGLLVLAMAAAAAFRRFRSGRILLAARDNQRAAMVYGIHVTRARLAAFAVSGAIAGLAGVMIPYAHHTVIPADYSAQYGIGIFLAAAIGGLGSLPTAVAGAMLLEATVVFGPRLYTLLGPTWATVLPLMVTGPLLVLQLTFYPGGLAQQVHDVRDRFLRWVARRRGIEVPSLLADRAATEQQPAFSEALGGATEELERTHTYDIVCPVCSEGLSMEQARLHPHLRVPQETAAVAGGGG